MEPHQKQPRRGLVVSELRCSSVSIRPDSYVWIMETAGEAVRIEFKGKSYDVAAAAILPVPIARPGIEQLRERDPCFGLGDEHFDVIHEDKDHWFRLLRCRTHHRYFLEDTRGGIAVYSRTILVDDDAAADPKGVWERYHRMSDDWLDYLAIAL